MARKLLGIVPNVGDSSNKEAPTSWITTALNLKLDKTGLSASTPLSYNSGTGALSIQAASTTQDGYLSSANFNTFNNKEGAITAGTTSQYWRGDKSWQDLPSAIRSTVLTGLVAGTNRAIAATDSILAAFQNLQAQVNNKLGSTAQATDSDKLDGQHGSYYQTALGYTPLKNTTDTLTGDLTLSGGSLYLPATGFSGAGPIQSTVAVKFANATAAQEAYMLKLRLGGTWSILDSNDPGVGGIYASGTIKASSFVKSGGTGNQFLKADGSVDSSSYESTITAGTTSQYYRGDKTWQTLNTAAVTESTNLYFTEARVRSTVLTGINTGSGGTVTETDTVLSAIGKLEYKSSVAGSGGLPSQTGNAGKVLTTDGSNASWSSTVSPLTITETSAIPYLSLTRSDLAHTITLTPTSANLLTSSAQIVLPSDPTTNLQAATKQYADNLLLSWPNASLASAITQWQSYTPAWTSLSNPQPSVGNGTFGGRWRRVGDSVECCIFMLTGTTTTFGTADWFFSLPAGLTIDTNKALSPLGHGMVWDNGSNSPLFGTVQVKDSQRVRVTNITNWNPTAVGWLSANDTIMIRFTVPIAEWSSNINLIKDFTEYAFNSSSTTSDDIVSFAYGKTGTNIVAYAGTGFDVLTKRVRFNTPILDSDIILIEFYNGTNWIPQHFAPFTDDSTGYGVIVIPLNTTDVNVSFRAKPNPVEAWSAYTSWKWRVRKISNGNFAQGSPSYTTTVGNGSATTITVTHNLGTSDVDVAIWELTGNRRKVDSGVEIRTNTTNPTTQVDLVFASAPAVNSLRVTVFSNGGTASLTSELQEFVSCDGTESGAGTSANTTYTLNNPVYGPNGSNFPAVAISSTTSTTVTNYDLPFINDIQPTDVLILEVNAGNRGWVPLVSGLGLLSPYTFANGVHTGVMLDRTAGSTNRIRVCFSNAGTRPGAAYGTGADTWTTIRNDASGYRWRVRKISNGNFSQLAEDQYSYSEVATNKRWVNGKTIYRKVINFGTLPNANSKSVAHGVTGITDIVSVRAFSGGTPIPFVGGSPTDAMTLWVDSTHFSIWCAGNKSAATAIGIFEYTK